MHVRNDLPKLGTPFLSVAQNGYIEVCRLISMKLKDDRQLTGGVIFDYSNSWLDAICFPIEQIEEAMTDALGKAVAAASRDDVQVSTANKAKLLVEKYTSSGEATRTELLAAAEQHKPIDHHPIGTRRYFEARLNTSFLYCGAITGVQIDGKRYWFGRENVEANECFLTKKPVLDLIEKKMPEHLRLLRSKVKVREPDSLTAYQQKGGD